MSSQINATPRVLFGGIQNAGSRTASRTAEISPQHYALIRGFAATGTTRTTPVVATGDFTTNFGSDTLSKRGAFYNNAIEHASILMDKGSAFMFKRLIPDDAPAPARLILGIDIVADKIPDATGTPTTNDDGTTTAAKVDGYRGRLVLIEDNVTEVGKQKVIAGNILSQDGSTQSKIYPLLELPTSFVGKSGNLNGIRLWAPDRTDTTPPDFTVGTNFKTRMLRIQLMEKATEASSPSIVKTIDGDNYVDFCLTKGAYSESTDTDYYGPDVVLAKYEDDGKATGQTPIYAPYSQMYVYAENLKEVQTMISEAIIALDPTKATELTGPDTVNVWTGVDLDGEDYKGFLLEGTISGGVKLGKDSVVYATGGGDGTTDLAMYEKLILEDNNNFGEGDDDYTNAEMFPFSVIYDTGLSLEAKYSMMRILGVRADLYLMFTTHVEGETRKLTATEELSRATAIYTRIKAYPESTLYNTGVCRASIVGLDGRPISSTSKTRRPLLNEIMGKLATMMGAGTGLMDADKQIDVYPNNQIETLCDFNLESIRTATAMKFWSAGTTILYPSDRRTYYIPAFKSVFADDTSPMISPITVLIACDAERRVRKVFAEFTGNSSWTDAQFMERCNKSLADKLRGRYAGRVDLVARAYKTTGDTQNGFSWTVQVGVYASNMRNVMNFELYIDRRDAYATNQYASTNGFTG